MSSASAPLWYGRETPSYLTQHSITYGYNWAGEVEGTIILNGKTVRVSGMGIRERYVAVDFCAAEIGGWEDWGWIGFNEIHSSLYDMRLGMKDFAMYDKVEGTFTDKSGNVRTLTLTFSRVSSIWTNRPRLTARTNSIHDSSAYSPNNLRNSVISSA